MEDFEIIYEKDKLFGDYFKCKHCGERVERGIDSVSDHWMKCLKRTDGLIITENESIQVELDKLSVNNKN